MIAKGLADVVVAQTKLSRVDSERGVSRDSRMDFLLDLVEPQFEMKSRVK